MKFVVEVNFHHGVDSVAVLVEADNKDRAETLVFERFELHEDWAVEFVSTLREATPADLASVPTAESFS